MEEFKLVPKESAFFDLSPDEVALLSYIIGIWLASSLTIDELRVLGGAFFLTGEVLLTIVAQRVLLNDALAIQQEHDTIEKAKQSIEELQLQNKKLEQQIQQLQQQINQLIGK